MSVLDKNPQNISAMFNEIANIYDFVNNITTFGLVNFWRKSLVKALGVISNKNILDVATGTGKLANEMAKKGGKVTAIDISEKMLEKASYKYKNISFLKADMTNLPFKNNSFDIVTISFGIRNVNDVEKALNEIYRVTKRNGKIYICEFSLPVNKVVKKLHSIYMNLIFVRVMKISQKVDAYKYLNDSIKCWFNYKEICKKLLDTNWTQVSYRKVNLGIVTFYRAVKKND